MNGKQIVNPSYNPDSVIIDRTYGVKDLKRYIEKIKNNIKIFQEAISKERKEMNRIKGMITVLRKDIYEAKQFKRLKKK